MTQIPSGWYDDPKGSGQLRYWDGLAWTEHLRPRADPLAMPAPTGMPVGVPSPDQPAPYTAAPVVYSSGSRAITVTQGSPRVGGVILIIMGIIFTITSLGSILPGLLVGAVFGPYSSAGPGAVETTGHVTDLRLRGADCTPLAEFTVNDETYQAVGQITYSPCNTAIGRAVTVSYLPSDISGSAIIADDSGFTDLISGTFVVGGIIFALVGVAMIWGGIVLFRFRRT